MSILYKALVLFCQKFTKSLSILFSKLEHGEHA